RDRWRNPFPAKTPRSSWVEGRWSCSAGISWRLPLRHTWRRRRLTRPRVTAGARPEPGNASRGPATATLSEARAPSRQSRSELNAVVLGQQLGHPVAEHADLARQMAVLRIHDM